MNILKLTNTGQLTIPQDIRKKYGIKPGTRIHLFCEEDGIKIIPVTQKTIRKYVGSLQTKGTLLNSLMKEKKIEREL